MGFVVLEGRKTFSSLLSMPCLCSEAKALHTHSLGHLVPHFPMASLILPGATAEVLLPKCAAKPSAKGTDRRQSYHICQINCQCMVAELSTAGLQRQNPLKTATVQIETHSKPEKHSRAP